jgi:hypothetical protein
MRTLVPAEVNEVLVATGAQQQRFQRSATGEWQTAGAPVPEETAQRLERGLRFLHVSAPQRMLTPADYQGTSLAEFGLDPPQYRVEVRSTAGAVFVVHYGALHPQGLAHYMRLEGSSEVILLPHFVGESWAALLP